MAFNATVPYVHNGTEYNYYGVSLITRPNFKESEVEGQIVIRLDPYRFDENGKVQRPMITIDTDDGPIEIVDNSAVIMMSWNDAYAKAAQDQVLGATLYNISVQLQNFISAKGH